jgi:branched-chain amino acid transport system substrate-binding protein
VNALGLQASQGLIMTEAWYWDLNDANREFAKKFAPQYKGIHPTMLHAGVYSAARTI